MIISFWKNFFLILSSGLWLVCVCACVCARARVFDSELLFLKAAGKRHVKVSH